MHQIVSNNLSEPALQHAKRCHKNKVCLMFYVAAAVCILYFLTNAITE